MARGKDVKRGDFYYEGSIDAGHYVTDVSTMRPPPGHMTVTFVDVLSASSKGTTVGPEVTWGPSNENNEFTGWKLSALPSEAHAALVAAGHRAPQSVMIMSSQPIKPLFTPDGKPFKMVVHVDKPRAEPRPRIEANADAGRTVCAKCGGQMKELFTSRYCPTCE